MEEARELNDFQKAFRDRTLREEEEARRINAAEEEFVEEDTQHGRYMTFKCADDYYGIAITYVNEIIGIQPIAEIPETPDYIKGLLNLRGKIVPVIDVRLRFRKEPIPYNDRTCVIVITVGNDVVGLVVDTIAEVVSIEDKDILTPPSVGNNQVNRFVFGIGKVNDEVKLLIDPMKLINDN